MARAIKETLERKGYRVHADYLLGQCLCQGKGLRQVIVEGTRLIAQSAAMNDAWGKLYIRDEDRWIFDPSYDSITSPYLT